MRKTLSGFFILGVIVMAHAGFASGDAAGAWTPPDPALLERAAALAREAPLIDGHNDTPYKYGRYFHYQTDLAPFDTETGALPEAHLVTDLPRLRRGGVGGQFWAAYISWSVTGPEAVRQTLEQIDFIHRLSARYPGEMALARSADDIERIHREGKLASLIGVEGGHCMDNSLPALRMYYEAGARYLTLTHMKTTDWCDAATDAPRHGGLSPFGREVVREMNRLGMMVDLSHVSPEAMRDAIDVSAAPVIFSHSGALGVCNHERNAPDDVLKRLGESGGIIMVPFMSEYLRQDISEHMRAEKHERERLAALTPGEDERIRAAMGEWRRAHPEPLASVADVANHIDYIRARIGAKHIGIGSDFEGFRSVVTGLEDTSCYPALLAELLRRGYTEEEVKDIAGRNLLRVMRRVEETGARLRAERQPSTARIEDFSAPDENTK